MVSYLHWYSRIIVRVSVNQMLFLKHACRIQLFHSISQRCPPDSSLFDDTSNRRILQGIVGGDATINAGNTNVTDCLCPLNVPNRGPRIGELYSDGSVRLPPPDVVRYIFQFDEIFL